VVQVIVTALEADDGERGIALGEERRGGAGVLLTADGFLLTNAHVVEGARRVQVVLAQPAAADAPGRSAVRPEGRRLPATIVGTDRETDLAVLKIDGTGFAHLAFGESDSLAPGNFVLAFGSPLGLSQSVSLGVVSAVGRQLEPDAPVVYLQTDASVNPGNSGGPLVDVEGRVVGINTMILSRSGGSEGIGFALPSNIARPVFDQLRAGGRVRRGVIGVRAQTITPALAAGLRLPQDWGVVIADVGPRSPAAQAGLRVGDVVTELNGKTMENGRQFDVNLYQYPPGATVRLGVRRGLERLTLAVRVVEREGDPGRFADLVSRERHLVAALRVLALPVTEDVARVVPWVRRPGGILVAAWDGTAPGNGGGLQPGDVIYALNGVAVETLEDLNRRLGLLGPGDPLVFHLDRLGQTRFVVVERD
jgi:serine protease Do